MPDEKLPYRILSKAADMFGGSAGFSYAEMADFFCHALNKHPDELGLVGGSNRPAGFKWWLSQFPVPQQRRLLLQLCRENYQMWHGQPGKKDREELAAMLAESSIAIATDPAKIDSQSIGELWRKALDRRHEDPEGAITAARTLLESVCKHILDESAGLPPRPVGCSRRAGGLPATSSASGLAISTDAQRIAYRAVPSGLALLPLLSQGEERARRRRTDEIPPARLLHPGGRKESWSASTRKGPSSDSIPTRAM
ncbi:MAG: hypothetical protein ABSF64_25425 [Bryobacteraceae bacterium]|jgi:hypothetical protein